MRRHTGIFVTVYFGPAGPARWFGDGSGVCLVGDQYKLQR